MWCLWFCVCVCVCVCGLCACVRAFVRVCVCASVYTKAMQPNFVQDSHTVRPTALLAPKPPTHTSAAKEEGLVAGRLLQLLPPLHALIDLYSSDASIEQGLSAPAL